MRHGIIISFNKKVGWGFIKDANGQKIRFKVESVDGKLDVNDLVSYDISLIETGLIAVNVLLLAADFGEKFIFRRSPKLKN